ncbi:hypothetical protein ICM_05916 [Bacillus cereus BAG1X2-3]|uniref:Uncharacterized protein n=2 Tax=Bacillus cereus group TaxID=86661 RepID=A0A9X7E170_BACCE|nr:MULTISPECIES: hypothetical protein [Bacillus cereus group]EOO25096.1 hypothetical protein ICC_05017 [Bacillus cereus BAG1X1-1]EOO44013.1 hypothetical protein ICI_05444 [Bacillus cereus BAG1X2-1]EOO46155.1 hypothetical protein ICK_05497 [Bacillus cereus BAG1X2-2]EOO62602.1 hypothetical protein ICM_05916 [Bacillus cereus BAG1X2-3]EOP01592.1 hypothetical protein ICO_05412 [Bacillus cereus BAG2O-1]
MKVTCLYNTGNALSKITEETFNLTIEKEYIVYGICKLQSGELTYLILGERENMPSWYPAELFKISDALQPLEWYCAEHKQVKETTIDYIWGYKELALDDTHALGLIERENKDMELFLKRKAEIDEFEELYK